MMKEKLKYLFYMLTHPIDAFYEIRHREKGSVPLALFVVFLAGVAFCMDKRYSSFVVNAADTREVKSLLYIAAMFLLFFLFLSSLILFSLVIKGIKSSNITLSLLS